MLDIVALFMYLYAGGRDAALLMKSLYLDLN